MRNYTVDNNLGHTYKRVSKKAAEKLYMDGKTVVISPVNVYPFNAWGSANKMSRKIREHYCADETGVRNDFNSCVASYEYYNCINSKTGKYAAFYVEEVA